MTKKVEKDPEPVVALSQDQFTELLSRIGGGGLTAEQLTAVITHAGQQTAEGVRQKLEKNNPNYVERSHLDPDPEGSPRPALTRECFFVHGRLHESMLTRQEAELLNRFTLPYYEAHSGAWKAEIKRNGSTEQLFISVPCRTADQRSNLPPFTNILRELLDGPGAVNVDNLFEENQKLKRLLAQSGVAHD